MSTQRAHTRRVMRTKASCDAMAEIERLINALQGQQQAQTSALMQQMQVQMQEQSVRHMESMRVQTEAHAAAGCQRRLCMHGRKLACITRASCANAHGARCSRPRRVRVCRGGCQPPAARWKRRSKLRIVVPIVQHNSVWSDHRIMLSKCWSVTMCWNHCRCYLSAFSLSCWWTGTPRWIDWSMWMLCGDFL